MLGLTRIAVQMLTSLLRPISPTSVTSPSPSGSDASALAKTSADLQTSRSTTLTASTGALTLFNPAHVPTSHGVPGGFVSYRSRPRPNHWESNDVSRDCERSETIELRVQLPSPEDDGSGGSDLMAQYVWNCGVLGAEMVRGLHDSEVGGSAKGWRTKWDLDGQRILELGAGEFSRLGWLLGFGRASFPRPSWNLQLSILKVWRVAFILLLLKPQNSITPRLSSTYAHSKMQITSYFSLRLSLLPLSFYATPRSFNPP